MHNQIFIVLKLKINEGRGQEKDKMLSDIAMLENSLKVKVLDNIINRVLLINGHLFQEELRGWVYIGRIINKGKDKHTINLYNRLFETKPTYLDLGVNEKNFYPHRTLPTEVCQRLTELYEFYKNNHGKVA